MDTAAQSGRYCYSSIIQKSKLRLKGRKLQNWGIIEPESVWSLADICRKCVSELETVCWGRRAVAGPQGIGLDKSRAFGLWVMGVG